MPALVGCEPLAVSKIDPTRARPRTGRVSLHSRSVRAGGSERRCAGPVETRNVYMADCSGHDKPSRANPSVMHGGYVELAAMVCDAANSVGLAARRFEIVRVGANIVLADRSAAVLARVSGPDRGTVLEDYDAAAVCAATGAPVVGPLLHGVQDLASGHKVTFWPLAEPAAAVSPDVVARLAALCHTIAAPDGLRRWDPAVVMARKEAELRTAQNAGCPAGCVEVLSDAWQQAAASIDDRWSGADTVTVHNDLHPGNVVVLGGEMRLCDLDSICAGPPETNIAKMVFHTSRFLPSGAESKFLESYGLAHDAQFVATLRRIREVSACMWAASLWAVRSDARPEALHRAATLDNPDARWAPL